MNKAELSNRVKELRLQKALSQEQLAENAGLSLRTIQRIENGETEARGDTLKRLINALNTTPDDLLNFTLTEDKGFLTSMNLSALGFLIFPLLGVIIPLIFWFSKKDKIKNINETGKAIINFQVTWLIGLFLMYAIFFVLAFGKLKHGHISGNHIIKELFNPYLLIGFFLFLYVYNILIIIANSILIYREKRVRYFPKIRFIR